jgi:protein-ribulosamine 3-kinase
MNLSTVSNSSSPGVQGHRISTSWREFPCANCLYQGQAGIGWREEVFLEGRSGAWHLSSVAPQPPTAAEMPYFYQLGVGNLSRVMLQGEYESMKALHNTSPDFVPYPLGYGTYESDRDMHFFMCDFIDVADKLPEKGRFCSKLADLHRRSQHMPQYGLESPTPGTDQKGQGTHAGGERRFGFPITTYNAKLPQNNTWSSSWESFYLTQMRQLFDLEREAQGTSPELDSLLPSFYDKVIPRLLRPLETGGHTLLPALIHGDLWHSNAAVRKALASESESHPASTEAEEPLIFDASAFYAHNEAELGMWRPERFKMRTEYVEEYFRHFPPSTPAKDWEDRNLLYSLRPDLQDSALFPSTGRFRELVIETVKYLVGKYPGGFEEWAKKIATGKGGT